MSNLSYSRLVNSSYAMLPVIPNVGNFSFSQQFHNVSVSASITKIGTGNAEISGSTYATTSYSFQVTASRANGKTITASGELSTLPSGLLYSATINAKGYTIQVALLGTNAALSASSQSSSTTTSAAIIGGSGAAIVGLGAFAFYKRRSSSSEPKAEGESKPLYHVD